MPRLHTSASPTLSAADRARLTVLIDPDKKRAFEALCASQDLTVSQVLRSLINEVLRGRPKPS
jgi:antitoxin component of RelBE/YafQ-DinJ toxin-antitoxin module